MAAVTCQAIRDLFSARVDDALTAQERTQLDAHLATCAECALEWQRFEGTVGLLRAAAPTRAPVGFVDRVLAARPQPWYRRLARGALVPWPVKLPLDAAAIVLIAGLAIMIFQHSPELQQAARAPQAVPTSTPSGSKQPGPATPPAAYAPAPPVPPSATAPVSPTPPVARRDGAVSDEAKERAAQPTLTELRREPMGKLDGGRPVESPRAAESRAKKAEAPEGGARQNAEQDLRAAAPPAAPPAVAATPEKSGEVQRLSSFRVDVQARLAVSDREAAERAVRDLVGRAGGRVLARTDEGCTTVLILAVPRDRWEDVRGGLQALGPLQLEGRGDDAARQLVFTLRLAR